VVEKGVTGAAVEGPRFSVVVPAHQTASTIGETLDAIQAQSFVDWECIVVDDGSTDDTLAIASDYARRDHRIRVIHQPNQGTAGAYNAGVTSASGGFIVICSADDVLLPEHLSRFSEFIDSEPGYDIYSSNGYFWWPRGHRDLYYDARHRQTVQSLELRDVIRSCFYSVGAVYRRDLFAAVGGYRLGIFGEDYDFWLRAMAAGARHRYLPEPLSLHRVSPSQKSARVEAGLRSDISLVSDLRRDFRLSEADLHAVDETIRERESQIARLNRPWSLYRNVLRPAVKRIAVGVLGPSRARKLNNLRRR
jgi:glycosyltransferase involved in cell wall biosynthesis